MRLHIPVTFPAPCEIQARRGGKVYRHFVVPFDSKGCASPTRYRLSFASFIHVFLVFLIEQNRRCSYMTEVLANECYCSIFIYLCAWFRPENMPLVHERKEKLKCEQKVELIPDGIKIFWLSFPDNTWRINCKITTPCVIKWSWNHDYKYTHTSITQFFFCILCFSLPPFVLCVACFSVVCHR